MQHCSQLNSKPCVNFTLANMEVEKLQRKNTWAETSMTPILTEYGMPEKQKKKKKKKFEVCI